jgi:methyl-accepting chemotaxis protein
MQEMSRMSQAIEQMSNTLISTDRLLEQFSDTANNGRESLKAMVVSMDTISARSMKISDITAMIQDIADRTNLLSINAALEAARAGIHGRGFAVVADEMVKLSDLTANSANLINEIIDENNKEIGKGTAMVNTAAQNINKLLEYGREFRTKMSETLEKMNIQEDTSRKVNRVLDDTLNAFQETKSSLNSQIQVIAAVKDSIEEINAISKENAMGALVLSRNTSDLMGMAEKLKNHINYFKLN